MTEREMPPLTRVIRALDDAMKAAKDANDLLDTIAPPPEPELATAEDWLGIEWRGYWGGHETRRARLNNTARGLRSKDLIVVKRKDWEEARVLLAFGGSSDPPPGWHDRRDRIVAIMRRTEPKP